MAKIIVTGGAGFIGSNLTEELINQGHEVTVIDNLAGGKKENIDPRAKFEQKDITELTEIKSLFAGVDYVFHLAALPRVQFSIEHPAEANNANVNGTLNVLIAAREAGVKRVVYSASSSAYGDQTEMPLRETMVVNPQSPYGLQKYIGELYCRMFSKIYQLPTVCLRYFNVYGPRQSAEGAYALVIAKFLKQKQDGKTLTITGDGTQTRDFTYVGDVVRANILAMQDDKVGSGEAINIGAGHNHSVNEIAQKIGGEIEYIPARLEPHDTLADISRAQKLLGWQPEVGIDEGLKRTIDWFNQL